MLQVFRVHFTFKWHYDKRQDELSNFVDEKMVEIMQKTKFSIQVDKSTIHNQAMKMRDF